MEITEFKPGELVKLGTISWLDLYSVKDPENINYAFDTTFLENKLVTYIASHKDKYYGMFHTILYDNTLYHIIDNSHIVKDKIFRNIQKVKNEN